MFIKGIENDLLFIVENDDETQNYIENLLEILTKKWKKN